MIKSRVFNIFLQSSPCGLQLNVIAQPGLAGFLFCPRAAGELFNVGDQHAAGHRFQQVIVSALVQGSTRPCPAC